jgi:alpha-tubulin suppressor-like RCC1 family protein
MKKRNLPLAGFAIALTIAGSTLSASAGVVAAGRNAEGQSAVPADLANASVTAVSAGNKHSVALLSNGSVRAWGEAKDNRVTPPSNLNAVAIDAGAYHTLAVTSDGRVAGWGFNGSGILSIPANLTDGSSRAIAVAAGDYHSLALKADGTVIGWGSTQGGRAVAPFGLAGVIGIAAGGSHSLAVTSDGSVAAWGVNDYGQTDVPAGLSGVIAVSAGLSHSVALKSDGSVVIWGRGSEGQTAVAGLSGAISISAGNYHTIAVTASGTVVSVGDSSAGQRNLPSGSGVSAASAGGLHSLAINGSGPIITAQPQTQTVLPGSNVTLSVAASNADSYQWHFNGDAVAGGADASLSLTGVSHANAGSYSVLVSGPDGATFSQDALLIVRGLQRIAAPVVLANGNVQVTFGDSLGAPLTYGAQSRFKVQASYDLETWFDTDIDLAWNNGSIQMQDAIDAQMPAKFYRVSE